MKYGKLMVTVFTFGSMMALPSAFAASELASACKSDLKKFGCTAKSDKDVQECLEKNEKKGAKNEGFTESCAKAHEAYEAKTGTAEKDEKS